jgi:hypothetical protein
MNNVRALEYVATITHVDEIVLEDAVRFGLLDSPDFSAVRNHVLECPLCRERLEEMDEFASWVHKTPENETAGSITTKHDTPSGTVFLVVTGSDAAGWEARAIGGGHYVMRSFARGPDAKVWLDQWYSAAFRSSGIKERLPFAPCTANAESYEDRSAAASFSERVFPAFSACKRQDPVLQPDARRHCRRPPAGQPRLPPARP